MKFHHTRRTAGIIAVLLGGLASVASVGPLAAVASASTSPTISYSQGSSQVTGSGFTPGGQVVVREWLGSTLLSYTITKASQPRMFCPPPPPGEPRDCYPITDGGQIVATLSVDPMGTLGCGWTETGTITATDSATGIVVSEPVTWIGMC